MGRLRERSDLVAWELSWVELVSRLVTPGSTTKERNGKRVGWIRFAKELQLCTVGKDRDFQQ